MELMQLPKIALGAWAWGNDGTFGGNLTADDLRPVFDAAMKGGLNLWDTAYVYGMGASEQVLGEFLRTVPRESYLISDKFTPQCADPAAENAVTAMYEVSSKLLGTDEMDIYWIHNPVGAPQWTRKLIPLANSGKIGRIGLSNHNLEEIKEAAAILGEEGLKISAIQNHYSLLNRSSETSGILEYCKENGITFFSYMVLEQGALTGKYDSQHPFPADFYYGSDGRRYGPDMEHNFVGDPTTNLGYICGTSAIVTAANGYLEEQGSALRAVDRTGASAEELYELVSQDTPVVVWVTIGMADRRATQGWYTQTGEYMEWSTNDHGAVQSDIPRTPSPSPTPFPAWWNTAGRSLKRSFPLGAVGA